MIGQTTFDDDVSPASRKQTGWSAAAEALATNVVQRILLVTDGTVTNILEAYAHERISVVKLRQATELAASAASDLEVRESDEILYREVLLQGRRSGRTFVYALSQIIPGRLDSAMRRSLLESVKPIGRLLEERRIETFREFIDAQREPAGGRGVHFGVSPEAPMISRTYRIIARGRPMMLITEKFPADAFAE